MSDLTPYNGGVDALLEKSDLTKDELSRITAHWKAMNPELVALWARVIAPDREPSMEERVTELENKMDTLWDKWLDELT